MITSRRDYLIRILEEVARLLARVTFGNLIVAFLAPLQKTYELSQFFWLFAGLMGAAAVVFAILAYFFKGKSYLQQDAAAH